MVPIETILPFLTETVPAVGFQCDAVSAAIIIIGLISAGSSLALGRNEPDVEEGPDPQLAIDEANKADKEIRDSRQSFLARESRRGPIQLQAPTLKI